MRGSTVRDPVTVLEASGKAGRRPTLLESGQGARPTEIPAIGDFVCG